jgi:hypothetical protein
VAKSRELYVWRRSEGASTKPPVPVAMRRFLGTIQPGKLRDVVVLFADYMAVPEDWLTDLPIDLTFVGGKVACDREKR